MSNKEATKAKREREIFLQFAEKMAWPVSDKLIESRPRGEPDILYRGLGEPVAFELSEICAPEVAQSISRVKDGGTWFTATADPTANTLRKKFEAPHTSEFRMELLCYWDARTASPDSLIEAEIAHFLQTSTSAKFSQIWYFGEKSISGFSAQGQIHSKISI